MQLLASFAVIVLAFLFARAIAKGVQRSRMILHPEIRRYARVLSFPLFALFLQWSVVAIFEDFSMPFELNLILAKVNTTWFLTRVISLFSLDRGMKKLGSIVLYTLTIFNILGLSTPVISLLDSYAFSIGDLHLSLFSMLKGGALFFILLKSSLVFSRWIEKKVKKSKKIEPSLQELFSKLIKTFSIVCCFFITLSNLGLNLSAFAFISGTIGVGLGFGLQKVVSNLICGIILLLDKSIKPGDVIALDKGKSYGVINRLGARCVSVRTRSGKEHLIPNEELIIHRSENWSLSDSLIRLSIPIRAHLHCNVELVMDLLLKATEGVNRVLKEPEPGARLKGFSENAAEFEIRVWINDPHKGLSRVKSDIYTNIWKLFKENGIQIPYAQREIHIKQNPFKELAAKNFENKKERT